MSRRYLPVLLAVAAGVLASSCTAGEATPPNPPTPTTRARPPTTTQTGPSTTFPPTVPRVLDINPYATKPCSLLTPDQRAALGLTFAKGQAEEAGLCYLDGPPVPAMLVRLKTYIHLGRRGGDDPSRWRNKVKPPDGRWTTIGGQPAATESSPIRCDAMVWTAPEEGVEIHVLSKQAMEERDDWCERATAILEPIVANLVG